MKINFTKYPALRLLIVAGCSFAVSLLFDVFWATLTAVGLVVIISFTSKNIKNFAYYLFGFSAGILLSFYVDYVKLDSPNKIIQDFPAIIDGKVVKVLKTSSKYQRLIVEGRFDAKALPMLENQRIILTVTGLQYKNIYFETGDELFVKCTSNSPKKKYIETDFPEDQYAAGLDVKWIAVTNARNVAITGTKDEFLNFADKQVDLIQNRIKNLFSNESYGIVTALLTGDKTSIDYETKQLFSLTGTAHVLAVSGLHVGIIATLIYFLLAFIRLPWLKFAIFSISIIAFVIFSGMQPSAIRAGIMAILYLLVLTTQRKVSAINIISFTTIIVIILFPEMFYSVGFHLSISAIAGIALLFKPIKEFFISFVKFNNSATNYIISSISITLASSIVVSPLVAYYFQVFSIISPLSNLFVIPLMTLSMVFSIIALIFSFIYYPIADIYASAGSFLIELSLKINNFAVDLPYSYIQGNNLIIFSTLISLALVYLIFSRKFNQLLFRLSFAIIIILSYQLFNEETNETVIIIPRQQFVALELNENANQKAILIFDRMPSQKPKTDFSFENYIKNSEYMNIYYCGNAGLNIVDKLKNTMQINSYEMDLNFQKQIVKKLTINEKIPQIINLKK